MGLFDAFDVAGSGLTAERMRMDVTSENLANADTTKTDTGTPYRRKEVVLQEGGVGTGQSTFANALSSAMGAPRAGQANGVQVAGIVQDSSAFRRIYDPSNPDADKSGYVQMPNVNSVTEMTDLISASRAYEANVTAMQTAKQMFAKTLSILS
jgi:flagellar basal-body rod protein FlgC